MFFFSFLFFLLIFIFELLATGLFVRQRANSAKSSCPLPPHPTPPTPSTLPRGRFRESASASLRSANFRSVRWRCSGFSADYWVFPGSVFDLIGFDRVFLQFSWLVMTFTLFCSVLLVFYAVPYGFTGLYLVLLGVTVLLLGFLFFSLLFFFFIPQSARLLSELFGQSFYRVLPSFFFVGGYICVIGSEVNDTTISTDFLLFLFLSFTI